MPVLKTPSPWGKQALKIYTKTIFDLLQEELVMQSGFLMDKIEDGIVSNKFCVKKLTERVKYTRPIMVLLEKM